MKDVLFQILFFLLRLFTWIVFFDVSIFILDKIEASKRLKYLDNSTLMYEQKNKKWNEVYEMLQGKYNLLPYGEIDSSSPYAMTFKVVVPNGLSVKFANDIARYIYYRLHNEKPNVIYHPDGHKIDMDIDDMVIVQNESGEIYATASRELNFS